MTREDLLTCWISGAPLAALARLLGEEPEALEDGLRMELRRLAEAERPPAGRLQAPSDKPARRKQTSRKPGGSASSPPAADLSGYPKPLQDPRATAQRAVWDALTDAPVTVRELAQRAGLEPPTADCAVRALRRHGLACTNGDVPAQWMRRQP
jgi:hypothetical protein